MKDKIILANPHLPKGKEFSQGHALSLLSRENNGGWYLKSGTVEGYPLPLAVPDLLIQSENPDAATRQPDKGDPKGPQAEVNHTEGG